MTSVDVLTNDKKLCPGTAIPDFRRFQLVLPGSIGEKFQVGRESANFYGFRKIDSLAFSRRQTGS